jgi:hypothetical protein
MPYERTARQEYPPGTHAPAGGTYEQRNVLGTPTGVRVSLTEGERLPAAPRGFTWSQMQAIPGSSSG